jgi:hypothetical protein
LQVWYESEISRIDDYSATWLIFATQKVESWSQCKVWIMVDIILGSDGISYSC